MNLDEGGMGLFGNLFGPPSKDVFARELMTALRRAGDRDDIVYERDQFRLVRPKNKAVTNLSNIYTEHCSLPRNQRRGHLDQLAQTFICSQQDLPEDFDEVRPHLRPKIWTRAQFAMMDLQRQLEGGEELNIPLYPLGEHLLTTIVYDLPTSMRTLSNDDLEGWSLSYYEALEIAKRNLEESTTAWAKLEGRGHSLHSSMSGDNYDSSRILMADAIREFEVMGQPIAMVPTRDSLLVTGSDDLDGLATMVEMAGPALIENPRPLSGIPLRLVDGEWEDWLPPADHPLAARFAWLAQQFFGALYADQQKILNALHEKQGLDLFVASFSAIESEVTGEQYSYCVWGEGVDAMLPETQYIMLPTESQLGGTSTPGIGGEWARVREIAGDLMQPVPDFYPPRWRVREFPSQAQLELIGPLDL